MKTICLFILIFAINISLFGQKSVLYRVTDPKIEQWERGYDVGYADKKGNMVIPLGKYRCCYNDVFDKITFVDIWNKPGTYAIDRKENVLFEVFICDTEPDVVQDGLFRIIKDDKIGFANMKGKIILAPQFEVAWSFSEGFAPICIGATKESDGEHTTLIGGKWKFINKKGKPINSDEYDRVRSFENGVAMVKKGEKWGKINRKGVVVMPIKYTFDEANK